MNYYTIALDVSGESLGEMIAAIEAMIEHHFAPLTDGDLTEQIAREGGEIILEIAGDRASAAAMLAKADDGGQLDFGLYDDAATPADAVLELAL